MLQYSFDKYGRLIVFVNSMTSYRYDLEYAEWTLIQTGAKEVKELIVKPWAVPMAVSDLAYMVV